MKKLLLALALTLSASALARAQAGGIERRDGDAFAGPVRSARIETALFVKQGDVFVEGPRRLLAAVSYSPDGKRRIYDDFFEEGMLRQRIVEVYDSAGRVLERLVYDERDELLKRLVYKPDTGEELKFDGGGRLLTRTVSVRNDGILVEVRTYDGSGGLLKRAVKERDGDATVWKTYDADGSMKGEAVARAGADGSHVNESRGYMRDGSPAGRRLAKSDAGVSDIEVVVERPDGFPPRKTRETREYDSRRNLARLVRYVWDDAAADFVPQAATYYTLTYYR